jgi:cell division protein FtsB
LEKKSTKKNVMFSQNAKSKRKKLEVSLKPSLVMLILEMILLKMLTSAKDSLKSNVVSRVQNFLEDRSKELLSPEQSSENQEFFSLMKLHLHWTKTPKRRSKKL